MGVEPASVVETLADTRSGDHDGADRMLRQLGALDRAIYGAVADTPTPDLDEPLRHLSDLASWSKLWIGIAGGIALVGGPRGRRSAASGLVSIVVTSAVVNQGIKRLAQRERPDREGQGVPVARQVEMPESTSFPSGHSASGFASRPLLVPSSRSPGRHSDSSPQPSRTRGYTLVSTIPVTQSSAHSSAELSEAPSRPPHGNSGTADQSQTPTCGQGPEPWDQLESDCADESPTAISGPLGNRTAKKATPAMGGPAIGLALTLIHLISIPVTNTSVNPARSTSQAIFAGDDQVGQLWLFWVAPLIGAAIGGAIHRYLIGDRDEVLSAEELANA